MNNKKLILIAALAIIILVGTYYALSYMLGPRIVFGLNSCITEKKIEFGTNNNINECGHNIELQIAKEEYTDYPFHFVNLTSFNVDGEDYVRRVNEGYPVKINVYQGTGYFKLRPNLVFGKGQGIEFLHPDENHQDWMVRVKSIENDGAILQIVHF